MDSTPPVPPHSSPEPLNTPGAPGQSGSYQRPADYYATPPPAPGAKSGCPKWLIFGCGGLGCLAIVLLFVLGWVGMRAGGGAFFGWIFTQIEDQSSEMMASDVTAEQRTAFNREFSRLKNNLRQRRFGLKDLQSVLGAFQSAGRDNALSTTEVDELTKTMKEANDRVEEGLTPTRSVSIRSRDRTVTVAHFCFS